MALNQNRRMNVLIVLAHPEPGSLSAALKNEAVATLAQAGHAVTVRDLYAMRWNPALGPEEFAHDRADAAFLDLSREQEHAHRDDSHAADVRAEQAKVAAADVVLLRFVPERHVAGLPAVALDQLFARRSARTARPAAHGFHPDLDDRAERPPRGRRRRHPGQGHQQPDQRQELHAGRDPRSDARGHQRERGRSFGPFFMVRRARGDQAVTVLALSANSSILSKFM